MKPSENTLSTKRYNGTLKQMLTARIPINKGFWKAKMGGLSLLNGKDFDMSKSSKWGVLNDGQIPERQELPGQHRRGQRAPEAEPDREEAEGTEEGQGVGPEAVK